MSPSSRRPVLAGVLLALVAAATGCSLPGEPTPTPTPTTSTSPDVVDPDVEALADRVGDLRATVTALEEALTATAGGEDRLDEAAALLVADIDAVLDPDASPSIPDAAAGGADAATDEQTDAPDDAADDADDTTDDETDETGDDAAAGDVADDGRPAPLLPGPLVSRAESVGYGDLLTLLLAASRSAGSDGAGVQRFLADPLAGDLGAWQRAPGDQLALIGDAGRASSLEAAESAILDLTGEAPRALAWVVHGLTEPDAAADAAGRALAHLAVVELALEQL